MDVQGIRWAGTRAERWADTVDMFERVLRLKRSHEEPGVVVFTARNGDTVEVFSSDEPGHRHFTTGPVVGFAVRDIVTAEAELAAAGVELLGPVQRGGGMAWLHFRGADGNVWELTSDDM